MPAVRRVFSIYLTQVLLLAVVGGTIGVTLGAILPFVISWAFGAIIPLPIVPALHPDELLVALFYGLLTALVFAVWPLGRAHDVPVAALFRDMVAPQPLRPRKRYVVLTVITVLVLAAFAVLLAYDRRVAIIYVGYRRRSVRFAAHGRGNDDVPGAPSTAIAFDRVCVWLSPIFIGRVR